MNKKRLTVLLSLALTFCSGGGGTSDPNKTSEEFDNPTGSLTAENLEEVVYGAILGNAISIFNDPRTIFEGVELEFNDCETTTGNETSLEWDCAFNNITQCTAEGQTITTDDDGKDLTNVSYEGFDVECDTDSEDISIQCEGETNISREDTGSYCSNLECVINGDTRAFDGCRNEANEVLVRLDGTFVVRSLSINEGCTQVEATIRDEDSTEEVTCDITETADGTCESVNDIDAIANCV